jgi:hypothetical protein
VASEKQDGNNAAFVMCIPSRKVYVCFWREPVCVFLLFTSNCRARRYSELGFVVVIGDFTTRLTSLFQICVGRDGLRIDKSVVDLCVNIVSLVVCLFKDVLSK